MKDFPEPEPDIDPQVRRTAILSWRCCECGTVIHAIRRSGNIYGNGVSCGRGRFICLDCAKVLERRRRAERSKKREGAKEHWRSVGDLPFVEGADDEKADTGEGPAAGDSEP